MTAILLKLLKAGVRTSEFWLSVLALALPYLLDMGSDRVQAWGAAHGWIGGLVVAVYVAGRAYVKGQTARAMGDMSPPADTIPAAIGVPPVAGRPGLTAAPSGKAMAEPGTGSV